VAYLPCGLDHFLVGVVVLDHEEAAFQCGLLHGSDDCGSFGCIAAEEALQADNRDLDLRHRATQAGLQIRDAGEVAEFALWGWADGGVRAPKPLRRCQ
jgi:hypothetical protein